MASTLIIYSGTGSQTDFAVPFDYLKKSFVVVSLQGTTLRGGDYGDTGADYYFIDKTNIRLKTAPASGKLLTIRRYTSATERIVTFKDASVLKATDLDTSQLQAFHIAEEARDIINDALIQDKFDNWDAKNHRIVNVADPVDPQDAVTYKVYKEDAQGAYQSKLEAQRARDLAKQWATKMDGQVNGQDYSSKYYADRSSTSAKVASDAETQAKEAQKNATAQAADAKASASTATTKASEASASASKAKTSETNAKTSETNAKASETKAKTSETNAKASETKAKASQDQATRQAQLAKQWAEQSADGQIQADWAQSDSAEKSYIKNKPNLNLYALLQDDVKNYGLGGGKGDSPQVQDIFGQSDLNAIDKTGFYTATGLNTQTSPNGTGYGIVLHIQRNFSLGPSAIQVFFSPNNLMHYRIRNGGTRTLPNLDELTNEQVDAIEKQQNIVSTVQQTSAPLASETWTPWYEIAANDNNRGLNTNYIKVNQTRWGVSNMSAIPLKGSVPSSDAYSYLGIYDSSGNLDNANNRLGVLQFAVRKDGSTAYRIIACQNKAGSTVASSIGAGVKADGSLFTYAPTPANTSNDTNIATTAFTQAVLGELKTGLTGGSVKVSKATTADTANAVAWNSVTGKPSTFNPSTHTHTTSQITDIESFKEIDSYQIVDSGDYYDNQTGYIRFKNKIQIVWGRTASKNTTITFPKAFANNYYAVSFGGVGDNKSYASNKATSSLRIYKQTASQMSFICIGKW